MHLIALRCKCCLEVIRNFFMDADKNIYIYAIFAKTVLLRSTFGFLHAIFVIPFLISLVEMVVPSDSEQRHSTGSSEIAPYISDSNIPENGNSLSIEACAASH
ncbi:hypothetical protein LOAG_05211 [Loa loa]|uniref:Uncharacterized protein n=1 Tax=Loa loa TaxID=7209 RepID=A0A1S0U0H1_LOALO|nr:hypothetical protein LOAG_05211 [Loa loa]EFO23274.1 hypothetical protein LOAG_05211 [Loa loa]